MSSRPSTGTDSATENVTNIDFPDDAVEGFALEVLAGPDQGMHWESKSTSCSVGFHPSCDVVLSDETVSKFHCEVAIVERGPDLRDLGSRNGTVVDGVRITSAFLKQNSLIQIGRSTLRFRYMGKRHSIRLSERSQFGLLIGRSVPMRAAFALLERVASANLTILLEGETGTGKSAAARSIHMESPRKDGPFIMLDCSALPANLLESELFGHEKGAFTGAVATRIGAFEEAKGGTVFLDEIGEMPLELQAKLLGVLENREIRRLGSNHQRPVDVRVIAATNRDLRAEVNQRQFREDLYYRIAVVKIVLPPLRERLEDLPLLVRGLLSRMGTATDEIDALMTDELLQALRGAAWPGNLRELRNQLEQYLVFKDLSVTSAPTTIPAKPGGVVIDASIPFSEARQQAIVEFERQYLRALLDLHEGKVARAAAATKLDRGHLYRLLRRHKLKDR